METTTKLYVFLIVSVLGCYFLNRLQNHLSLYSSYYQGSVTVSQPLQTQNQSTWTPASSGSHVEDSIEREIHDIATLIHPKAFRSWQQRFGNNDTPLPCIIDHEKGDWNPFDNYIQHQPTMEGFLFVKIEKAASSTLAGIAARMSVKIGQRLTKEHPNITQWYDPHTQQWHTAPGICRTRMSHIWSTKGPQVFIPGKRNPQKSFLWTFFKEPSRRALSEFFYFFVDLAPQHKRQSTDDATILEYLMRSRGSQIRKIVPPSLATPPQWTEEQSDADSTKTKTTITKTMTPSDAIAAWLEDDKAAKMNVSAIMQSSAYESYRRKVTDYVQSALDQMDFLGIVERMDKSLVLLQWILDLSPGDVMTINAKSAGFYHYKRKPKELIGKCVLIPQHTLSPVVKAFIESDEWKYVWNLADYMIYEAIHKSLNHTIDTAMGRESSFPAALAEFQNARTMVQDYCSPPNITLQCSPNGTAVWPSQKDPCYWGDAGCAYNCLDMLFST